ncbi:hypothetical protein VE00_07178 [Pseudogymnoascus sp. WSF 3629]|nr:hypothetical protein VE00_07178 [Pseudogymnoascus sp. WSF 3629]
MSANETAILFSEIPAKSGESVAKAAWITLVDLIRQPTCLEGYTAVSVGDEHTAFGDGRS